MKTFFPRLLSLLLLFGVVATMSAKSIELSFKTVPKTLETSSAVNVVYVPGLASGTRVTITGPDNKVGNVYVSMSGSTLTVGMTKEASNHRNNGNMVRGVKVTVHTGLISNFEASSASEIKCTVPLDYGRGKVKMDVSSAADVEFAIIRCGSLDAGASSAGDLEIDSIEATSVSLDSSSAADIEVGAVKADSLKVSADSGSDIEVKGGVVASLKAHADSGADIDLRGLTARTKFISKDSGGSVKTGTR